VGRNGDRALRKEQQRKPRLLEPVNGCNDKEARGHDEGQNTECHEQLEKGCIYSATDWQIKEILACKILKEGNAKNVQWASSED
jgi:hypothetical protein